MSRSSIIAAVHTRRFKPYGLTRLAAPLLLAILTLTPILIAQAQVSGTTASEGEQIGKVLNVRKVLRDPYFVSRYPTIHYYLVYFEVRASARTYCSEYETPVLDEIQDVFSAKDKDVEFVLKGKNLKLKTPQGRMIKAHLVEDKQC